jgi:orotidine-5'-phosphate decarboxylase
MSAPPRVIVALDFDNVDRCQRLVEQLDPTQVRLKVGKELFTRAGPALVEKLIGKGFSIFLDLKYHDIPNTVAQAVKAAADLGVWMVNVHASGGSRMLLAARDAIGEGADKLKLIGVTVLTSMAAEDLKEIGIERDPETQVLHLANLVKQSGLDGVVCSAQEVTSLRQHFGADFLLVTPGIRPAGSGQGDQRRTLTPAEALAAGSDYLVIGRPITAAENPKSACDAILASL